jgi:hypothetical protein
MTPRVREDMRPLTPSEIESHGKCSLTAFALPKPKVLKTILNKNLIPDFILGRKLYFLSIQPTISFSTLPLFHSAQHTPILIYHLFLNFFIFSFLPCYKLVRFNIYRNSREPSFETVAGTYRRFRRQQEPTAATNGG